MIRAVVSLVVAAGCAINVPRDQAVAKASAARARGDVAGEALALREACASARDDRELCARAGQAWQAALVATRAAARASCPAVQSPIAIDGCLAAVAQIRRLAADDADAAALADVAARQHAAHCEAESPRWQTALDEAVELIRCQDGRAASIGLAGYAERLATVRVAVRDRVVELLDRPELSGHPGALAELAAAASCLAPTPGLVERARTARAGFVERARASIDLRATSSTPLPGLCAAAAQLLGDRVACDAPRPGAPQLTVVGHIALSAIEHAASEGIETADYVAGILRDANPDHQPAVREEQAARQARDQAESTHRRDRSDCDSAESTLRAQSSCSSCPARAERDRACSAARSSEQLLRRRGDDWDRARSRLSSTPQVIEREDVRTASFAVRRHTWRATWQAELRNDAVPVAAGGFTTASDRETAGAAIAGVPADPLTPPGDRWFVPAVRDQVAARIAEVLAAALARRASNQLVGCAGDLAWTGPWLDCRARVRLWRAEPAAPDALLRLAGELSDRRRGAAWPPLACR